MVSETHKNSTSYKPSRGLSGPELSGPESQVSHNHSPRVSRKRLERQTKIVDSAMKLLAEGGLENVTVKRLAEELDYTPGALYRYFPSMSALFAQMQARVIDSLHKQITEAIAQLKEQSSLTQLRAAAHVYLEASQGKFSHELSLIGQMLASPNVLITDAFTSITAQKMVGLLMLIDGLIDDAQNCGELSEGSSRARAVQLWAALQGAVAIHKMSRFDPTLFSGPIVGKALVASLLLAWKDASQIDTTLPDPDLTSGHTNRKI